MILKTAGFKASRTNATMSIHREPQTRMRHAMENQSNAAPSSAQPIVIHWRSN